MTTRACVVLFALSLSGKEIVNPNHAETADVIIDATAVTDSATIKQLLGSDLGGYYTVVQVKLTPRHGKLNIQRDDFLLRTFKDGEHSRPLSASEIVGSGALVVKQVGGTTGMAQRGPSWGGMGMPGSGPAMGNGAGATATIGKIDNSSVGKIDPMLKVLDSKILAEKEASEPVSGLLIFPLEKQRLKDLELEYKSSPEPLKIHFR